MLDRLVSLQLTNRMDVEVRSEPGSSLTITVIGVDNDPPVIHATASPTANAAGWNNSNVTVTFTCSDATSGVAVCPAPVLVSAEGANQVISGQAVDKAGNTASTSVTLNIDKTPPGISATANPPAKAAGWRHRLAATTLWAPAEPEGRHLTSLRTDSTSNHRRVAALVTQLGPAAG